MQRQLIVLRHGEAESSSSKMPDRERPLTNAGERSLIELAERFKDHDISPTYFLTSSAVRAISSTRLLSCGLDIDLAIDSRDDLYLADYLRLLEQITTIPDSFKSLCLVGHNPGLSDLVYALTGKYSDLKPAEAKVIGFDTSWFDLVPDHSHEINLTLDGAPL